MSAASSGLPVLTADCSRCQGLCCVVPAFAASSDFAFTKPGRTPCPHLATDHRCGIHPVLRERGMVGCTVYDCLGAGQRVCAAFAGRTWRDDPVTAEAMFTILAAPFGAWIVKRGPIKPFMVFVGLFIICMGTYNFLKAMNYI